MTRFSVLDAGSAADYMKWLALWARWSEREVSAHPAYAEVFAESGDRVVCAALECDQGGIIFPLVMRPLGRETWVGRHSALWDVTSPYGYGGPFSWGCPAEDVDLFWAELRRWAAREHVVSLFARLSLFDEQLARFDGTIVENAPNVVRRLDLTTEALWMDYEPKVRKNVKRARREGLVVELDPKGSRLDEFLSVYHGSMERRRAGAAYFFDRTLFVRLLQALPGQCTFLHTLRDGVVLSTELVLGSTRFLYSFLGGTRAESFAVRPNDLHKHEVCLWGMRTGRRAFVLGGGYGGRDGIFRYKRSFAPHGEVPFRTGEIVFDEDAYGELVNCRGAWERQAGSDWKPRDGYFPAYRAPGC